MIEDGRAGSRVVCVIDRYDACGHSGATRTVVHHPCVSRCHLRRCCLLSPTTFGSTAAVGREAFIDVKKPLYTAFEYMLGLTCQRFGSIGQTDAMVPRDGSGMLRSRAVGPSGPRIGEDGTAPLFSQCMSCCSHLDEAGEPSAPDDLARDLWSVRTVTTATDGSDADPVVGKGLSLTDVSNHD